jgi:uncharacterized membrane protein
VLSIHTARGQNWSVEVRAFDGLDEGAAATAWKVIENAPPTVKTVLPNPEMKEDTVDDQWLNLAIAFEDQDGDKLTWSVNPTPQHIQVAIDPATGRVTLRPAANWFGDEAITFMASDGQFTASQTVLVKVTSVNDIPSFATMNGEPITSDPVVFHVKQGETLTIIPSATDVEGDTIYFSVNTTSVQLDEGTGTITFQPGNDEVGSLRFALTMWDVVSTSARVGLNITIVVENKNDPMDAPRIKAPQSGAKFKVDQLLSLVGSCTDPDTVYGQLLNYTWRANGTLLGYGPSLTVSFTAPGTYIINLTVTDGEFTRGVEVPIVIEAKEVVGPPVIPGGGGGKEGTNYGLIVGAIIAVCVILLVAFMLVSRRRAAAQEAADEREEKREDFKHMAAEVKATADEMEREVAVAKAAAPPPPVETTKIVTETRGPDGQVVSSAGVPEQTLAVQPKETEAASAEVQKLFRDMETKEAQLPSADAEALRIESLKRKYQTAIGRLPYGIPAAELKGRDWNELAGALATGQKKEAPDGRELTLIGGRWYYSDVKDASSFLTEHGAKPKAETKNPTAAPTMDRATILAKLEERLAMGEISEETYKQLRRKYEGK